MKRAAGPPFFLSTGSSDWAKPPVSALAAQLQKLDSRVFPAGGDKADQLPKLLSQHMHARLQEVNQHQAQAFTELKTRADWERFRDVRIQTLRESLGTFPPVPRDLKAQVTGTLEGDGYRIDRLVFESRPGLVATANLYHPAKLMAWPAASRMRRISSRSNLRGPAFAFCRLMAPFSGRLKAGP